MTSTDIHIENLRKKGIDVQKVISKTVKLAKEYTEIRKKEKPQT